MSEENKVNLAPSAEEAAVLLFRMGFTPIQVVGKNPAFGEGSGWQRTHYSSETDVRSHFKDWNGTQMALDEHKQLVPQNKNIGVLCDGYVLIGHNSQETLDAFRAECPFYDETLARAGNNPYPCAIFKRADPKEKFWSGQKILTNEQKPQTMCDIWGNGNQFVAWGKHPKGTQYRFTNDLPILTMKTADIIDLVARVMNRLGDSYKLKIKLGGKIDVQKITQADFDLFAEVKRKVRMKDILKTTETRITCPLHQQGTSNPAAVIYEDPEGDQLHCHSSGCHADVISLHAKQNNFSQLEAALDLAEKYGIEIPRATTLAVKGEMPVNEDELVMKINDLVRRAQANETPPNRGKIIEMCAKFLYQNDRFRTPSDTQVLHRYSSADGIYWDDGEVWVLGEVQRFLDKSIAPELISTHIGNEVVAMLKRLTFIARDKLEPDVRYTPLANGIYDFAEEKLLPFTPELFFTRKLAVTYDPEAKCPAIEKFISEVVLPEDKEVLFELAGYILRRSNPLQKAWLFDGGGNNGKSTYIKMIERMVGKDNTCSAAIQKLENNRFSAAELDGKYLSSVADLSGADLKSTGVFKAIVGGDLIQAERKGQHPFRFYPWAKLVYSCNKIPDSGVDDSNAFYRRWILITFPYDFAGKEDVKLVEKITTPNELSGLLNRALAALKEVEKRGTFTGQKMVEELRKIYVSKSNSVKAFLGNVEHDPIAFIPKSQVWKEYFNFCKARNLIPKSEQFFWRELKPLFDCDEKMTIAGQKHIRVVKGMKLKNMENDSGKDGKPPEPKDVLIKVKFLSNVPAWLGLDGCKYGGFEFGDITQLPSSEAIAFIKRGICSKINGAG